MRMMEVDSVGVVDPPVSGGGGNGVGVGVVVPQAPPPPPPASDGGDVADAEGGAGDGGGSGSGKAGVGADDDGGGGGGDGSRPDLPSISLSPSSSSDGGVGGESEAAALAAATAAAAASAPPPPLSCSDDDGVGGGFSSEDAETTQSEKERLAKEAALSLLNLLPQQRGAADASPSAAAAGGKGGGGNGKAAAAPPPSLSASVIVGPRPLSLGNRGRIVSLDRRDCDIGSMYTSDEDDDDGSSVIDIDDDEDFITDDDDDDDESVSVAAAATGGASERKIPPPPPQQQQQQPTTASFRAANARAPSSSGVGVAGVLPADAGFRPSGARRSPPRRGHFSPAGSASSIASSISAAPSLLSSTAGRPIRGLRGTDSPPTSSDSDDSSGIGRGDAGDETSEYSSDGESSYFSEHLPSPKSATRRSSASNSVNSGYAGSAGGGGAFVNPRGMGVLLPPGANGRAGRLYRKESDASLSFSDEDDDDADDDSLSAAAASGGGGRHPQLAPPHHGNHGQPLLPPAMGFGNQRTGVRTPSSGRGVVVGGGSGNGGTGGSGGGGGGVSEPPEDGALELFPRRITRLHSVSSLVSSSSESDTAAGPGGSGGGGGNRRATPPPPSPVVHSHRFAHVRSASEDSAGAGPSITLGNAWVAMGAGSGGPALSSSSVGGGVAGVGGGGGMIGIGTPSAIRDSPSGGSVASLGTAGSARSGGAASPSSVGYHPRGGGGGDHLSGYDRRRANSSGLSSSDDNDGTSTSTSSDPSVRSELRTFAATIGGGSRTAAGGGGSATTPSADGRRKRSTPGSDAGKPSGRITPVRDMLAENATPDGRGGAGGGGGKDNPADDDGPPSRPDSAADGARGGFLSRFFSSPTSAKKAVSLSEKAQSSSLGSSGGSGDREAAATAAAAALGAAPLLAHPQAHHHHPQAPVSPREYAAWLTAQQQQHPHPHPTYGSQAQYYGRPGVDSHNSSLNAGSHITLPMVYSDDDDDDDDDSSEYARNVASAGGGQPQGQQQQPRGYSDMFRYTLSEDGSAASNGMADGGGVPGRGHRGIAPIATAPSDVGLSRSHDPSPSPPADSDGAGAAAAVAADGGYRLYWQRWLMLLYVSTLNLLSDWTCYSVAPISVLTSEAFGQVNPELLVVVFLAANAVATACEPVILSRLGLRRTIVFGSLLLMAGSVAKSGGVPLVTDDLRKGRGAWRVFLGFFLVGLSQPLYQCTPALLSASWFPEKERTLATGIALNSNQLGIGCAFVFGTILVGDSDDIPRYFGFLSLLSTLAFFGCAIQFDDAPPTPPSDSARIVRGTLEVRMPSVRDMIWRTAPQFAEAAARSGMMKRAETQSGRDRGPPSLYPGWEVRGSTVSDRSHSGVGGGGGVGRRSESPQLGAAGSSAGSRARDPTPRMSSSSSRQKRKADRPSGESASGGGGGQRRGLEGVAARSSSDASRPSSDRHRQHAAASRTSSGGGGHRSGRTSRRHGSGAGGDGGGGSRRRDGSAGSSSRRRAVRRQNSGTSRSGSGSNSSGRRQVRSGGGGIEGSNGGGGGRRHARPNRPASSESGFFRPAGPVANAPAPAMDGPTASAAAEIEETEREAAMAWRAWTSGGRGAVGSVERGAVAGAPSPMMPGRTDGANAAAAGHNPHGDYAGGNGGAPPPPPPPPPDNEEFLSPPQPRRGDADGAPYAHGPSGDSVPSTPEGTGRSGADDDPNGPPDTPFARLQYKTAASNSSSDRQTSSRPGMRAEQFQDQGWAGVDPYSAEQQMRQRQRQPQPQPPGGHQQGYYADPYYYQQAAAAVAHASQYQPTLFYQPPRPPPLNPFHPPAQQRPSLPATGTIDDGAEPVVTLTPHNCEIDIRDDQILLSGRACLSRPGFVHALVAFVVSGIVINTLSTYMDYLVRVGGGGRRYVGIVGGTFQVVIMLSSLVVGRHTDKTRAYYAVIISLLVLGAFALAECGVSLDADRGGDVRWALILVAALVGPLQPVATELGVDVAYPLSENTVLVIQQLFSNLLSAMFIPFFKLVRDVGTSVITEEGETFVRPRYTFSFYLLIVVHALATVFFASFNGRYIRYEHEQAKKARVMAGNGEGRQQQTVYAGPGAAFQPVRHSRQGVDEEEGRLLLDPHAMV